SRFSGRVIPTFRPDRYLTASHSGWREAVSELIDATDVRDSYQGYLEALQARRAYFIAHGAVSADHGVGPPQTVKVDQDDAAALFTRLRSLDSELGDSADADMFEAHMLYEMARMSVEDGLVMTVHPGVLRNHHAPTAQLFGSDTGHDIPLATEFTQS